MRTCQSPEFGSNLWAESRTKGLTWGSRLQGADAAFLGIATASPRWGTVTLCDDHKNYYCICSSFMCHSFYVVVMLLLVGTTILDLSVRSLIWTRSLLMYNSGYGSVNTELSSRKFLFLHCVFFLQKYNFSVKNAYVGVCHRFWFLLRPRQPMVTTWWPPF